MKDSGHLSFSPQNQFHIVFGTLIWTSWVVEVVLGLEMKSAVIYFLVLFIHLFGGYTASHAAVSGYNRVGNGTAKPGDIKHFSTTREGQSLFFQGKNEEQELADYLIYVEDEDDDRNVSKKISSLNYTVLNWLFEPVSPIFLRDRLSANYHLSNSSTDKYLTHRALRI